MFCRRCCRCRFYNRGMQIKKISFEQLKDMISKGAILIDVRSPQEYNEGHLPNAINIPEYEIEKRINREVPKLNQQIILYCQYGGRSDDAYNLMRRIGYNNIFSLEGGLDAI